MQGEEGAKRWRELPWWLRETYLEGLAAEGLIKYERPAAAAKRTTRESVEKNPALAPTSSFRSMGITVVTGG